MKHFMDVVGSYACLVFGFIAAVSSIAYSLNEHVERGVLCGGVGIVCVSLSTQFYKRAWPERESPSEFWRRVLGPHL